MENSIDLSLGHMYSNSRAPVDLSALIGALFTHWPGNVAQTVVRKSCANTFDYMNQLYCVHLLRPLHLPRRFNAITGIYRVYLLKALDPGHEECDDQLFHGDVY